MSCSVVPSKPFSRNRWTAPSMTASASNVGGLPRWPFDAAASFWITASTILRPRRYSALAIGRGYADGALHSVLCSTYYERRVLRGAPTNQETDRIS